MTSQVYRPHHCVSLLVFALLLCGFLPGAKAQTRGAVGGTVTDQAGAILQGAQISTQSPALTVSTNEEGRFYINGLAPGTYNLTITYVGLAPFTTTVSVSAGQTANVDAQLHVANQDETVVVTAGRASAEAEAINVERAADNLLQVMPNEVITSLPNANLADALGRLPSVTLERDEGEGKYVQVRSTEPRLTNTTVDGVNLPSEEPGVRQIKFDAIPSSLVESVQISKTLQANMEGDGIGGSVNLVTKTATDTPTVEITGLGGITPIQGGRGNTTETATLGRRFGASKKLGIIVGGSYDWEGRGIDDIEPSPDENSGATWFDGMSLREYQYFRSRYGLAGSADYRIRDGSNLYARFLYSDFKNYGDRWAYQLQDNTPGVSLLAPQNQGGTPSYDGELRNPDIQVGSLIIGGNHVFNRTWYTWEANIGRSSYGNSPYSDANFGSTLPSSNCQFNQSATKDKYLPQWTQPCFTEIQNPANFVMTPTVGGITRDLGEAVQLNLGVGGSGAWQYHIGNRSAVFEYGGKFRNEHKYADTYVLSLSPYGTLSMSQFPNRMVNHNYYNGGAYQLGYNVSLEDVLAYANSNPTSFSSSSTQGQDPSQFGLVEQVSAGYVMNTIDFSNGVRFIAGLRAENTFDGVHNLAFGDSGAVAPNAFSGSYYTLLPSASLRFRAGPESDVRLIYARGLSRPDPQDIAQPLSWSINGNGANKYSVTFGNANLKAETGDDVDVLFNHYLKPLGIISVGYFYKSLQNPIVTSSYQLPNYLPPGAPAVDRGNYLATQPVNAGSAWLSGFEASYLQHYSALPGFLGGLGLSANYSYIGSSTNGIPGRSDHPRLLRNSPNVFNISPTYDRGRYSLRMGISYNQANIAAYQYTDGMPGGIKGPLSDQYFYSHIQVDAQGIIGLRENMSLVLSGLNLNNEVFGFYQGSQQYMIQREYYQPTFSAGIRWTPTHKEK
ncbi:TonB-dependent receptor [Acidicapsa acidisoli]|uniref:TonB-dependent receptor n=1 Tax=Acidicapsa acidisoli TaxID=1615681 RepID=UPI0021E0D2EB|nr:TonB-dependent receptor [Acidicapsa acidisoli]